MIKLGLLGAGGINRAVATAVKDGQLPGIEIVAVAGSTAESQAARDTAALTGAEVVTAAGLAGRVDWVVEAANAGAVVQHAPALWNAGVNTIIMSISAMLDTAVEQAAARYRAAGGKIVLPSGAIAGLDGVRAMNMSRLEQVRITTTKSPAGLAGAPYLVQNSIELPADEAGTVFEGNAREAGVGFPANVNVAVALSLAGIGPDLTTVVVRSDPFATTTVHEILAIGDSAELRVELRTRPSPANPRTSYLAALSAIAALREVAAG